MYPHPEKPEISQSTIKLIVGVIAVSLAGLTGLLSKAPIDSISASYHVGGPSRDVFVGFLFALSAFLFAYNGKSSLEMILSKIAAVASIGIAVFPCTCPEIKSAPGANIVPHVHGLSAAIMFLILAVMCGVFYRRAVKKGHAQAKMRACIYAVCGGVIILSITAVGLDQASGGAITEKVERLTYIAEAAGLVAFGIAWLIASRMLPVVTRQDERNSILPFTADSPKD